MPVPRRSRSTLIVTLLIATLALTATLAYEAQQAARSHRAAAENVLRDYAAFAAWEFSRLGRQQLLNSVQQALTRLKTAMDRGGLEAAVASSPACRSGCGGAHAMRTVFAAALPDARFTFAGSTAPPEVAHLLNRAIATAMRAPKDFTCPALRVVSAGGPPLVVVWRPVHDQSDKPIGVIGFTSDPEFMTHIFASVLKNHSLLPPSLMGASADPNSLLALRVATPDGLQLFSSTTDWSTYAADQQFQNDLGALKLSVALRPDAAGRLIIGGLPRERLPLVVGLLALTAGLVVVALVQLRREAELSRLRSDFVSGVSHELRTPLAQIRMFSETLLLGRVRSEHEGRRSLEIIAREAQRLAQLVENVLLFSRGEQRAPQISPKPARLSPMILDVVESFAPLAAARQTQVLTQLDDRVSANVDAGALRQIVLNLLDNAVNYGPVGQTVSVVLRLEKELVRIEVTDEGPGIDPGDVERIWQPFNRLANAAAVTGGAGIGLAIVRQLAELHGGRAWVDRTPAGSRFVVELPGAWSHTGDAAAVA
jgi:signal transduction histidine kinase